jgi:hypothetical protein
MVSSRVTITRLQRESSNAFESHLKKIMISEAALLMMAYKVYVLLE